MTTPHIIHTSDRHYGQPGSVAANAAVNNAIVNRPDVGDLVLIDTGDDVETPDPVMYETAMSAGRELSEAVREEIKTPGNHDKHRHGTIETAVGDSLYSLYHTAVTGRLPTYPQVTVVDDIAIIALDTTRAPEGRASISPSRLLAQGCLGDDQIELAAELVKAYADHHTVVALHHCPSGGNSSLRLRDRHELGEALDEVGGCDVMLAGHLHEQHVWRGIHGADWLFSAPKTPEAGGYLEFWWEGERLEHRWMEV